MTRLADAEEPIREALERLAESPHELRCFVIVEEPLTKRFVQLCTPPPPSRFVGGPGQVSEPLIFDGTGDGKSGGYQYVLEPCGVERGVELVLSTLAEYLPGEAELRIIEESTQMERPS